MKHTNTNPSLPKFYLPRLFNADGSKETQIVKYVPNPLKFTTESSMEDNVDLIVQKKRVKPGKKTENWIG